MKGIKAMKTSWRLWTLAILFSSLCHPSYSIAQQPIQIAKSNQPHVHVHASQGPNNGDLLEVGKCEYHLEACVDEKAKKLTVYMLDGNATAYIAIDQENLLVNVKRGSKPVQYKLTKSPQDFDEQGFSSRYILQDQGLFDALHDPHAEIRLAVKIKGKPYTVKLHHTHHHHDATSVR